MERKNHYRLKVFSFACYSFMCSGSHFRIPEKFIFEARNQPPPIRLIMSPVSFLGLFYRHKRVSVKVLKAVSWGAVVMQSSVTRAQSFMVICRCPWVCL